MVPVSTRRSTPALATTLPNCLVNPRNSTAAVVSTAIGFSVSEFELRESMLLSALSTGSPGRFMDKNGLEFERVSSYGQGVGDLHNVGVDDLCTIYLCSLPW